ncbi:MAG: sigma-70 family RNA polymerase sigma factor [Hyphomicrobiaceae bacterium]
MSTGSDDLSRLMRAANRGDEGAYRQLLGALALWLRPIVRRGLAAVGRSGDETEDIVQETLLAIHLKRATWIEDQPIEPWARAIARYKLVDHLRRRGSSVHVTLDESNEPAMDGGQEGRIDSVDLSRLLDGLGARQREIVSGISIEGLSAREMGDRLGMSEGAVRVALHRALRMLAEAYRRSDA